MSFLSLMMMKEDSMRGVEPVEQRRLEGAGVGLKGSVQQTVLKQEEPAGQPKPEHCWGSPVWGLM